MGVAQMTVSRKTGKWDETGLETVNEDDNEIKEQAVPDTEYRGIVHMVSGALQKVVP